MSFPEIEEKLRNGIDRPIDPRVVNAGPVREILIEGEDVDLYKLPVPLFSVRDGGPMITAGVTLVEDEEMGLNAGIYRFLIKDRNTTGIDVVTPNNLRKLAEKALAKNEPLPISINIGTHPAELITGCFKAAAGVSEISMSGECEVVRLSLLPVRPLILHVSLMLKSYWRRKFCQPDGPCPRAALENLQD